MKATLTIEFSYNTNIWGRLRSDTRINRGLSSQVYDEVNGATFLGVSQSIQNTLLGVHEGACFSIEN